MEYNTQEPVYETPRPPLPILWMGLTAFFAVCCCAFFIIAAAEAIFLLGVTPVSSSSTPAPKPTVGEIKFYLDQTSSGQPSGSAVTTVPTSTKAIYAYFTYKGMPRSGLSWSYQWLYNGTELPGASKTDQRWTREGSGTFFVKLSDEKGLKPGDYDLAILINGEEVQFATIHVGP